MVFLWAALRAESFRRPPGYLDAISAAGERRGDRLWIAPEEAARIRREYPPSAGIIAPPLRAIAAPPLRVQFLTLCRALLAWSRDRFRLAPWPVIRARRAQCLPCPFRRGRLVPRCALCGCTDFKLFLPASKCPAGRWKK